MHISVTKLFLWLLHLELAIFGWVWVWVVTKRGGYGVLSTASSLQSCCLNCSLQVGLKEKKITKDLIFKFFNYLFAHLLIC
jgi:hypothetical protein